MNAPLPFLPAFAPPHDPTSLLLNGHVGWRAAGPGPLANVQIDPCHGGLELAYLPATARKLAEASGSLGGLRLPGNVAFGPDDSLYLLDRKRLHLRRFDPCTCTFEIVPCIGGEGGGARELRNPGDIAICGGNLFVVDTGIEKAPEPDACDDVGALNKAIQRENHRISVFSLKGFALRGHLRPPTKELPWRPVSIAFDSLSRAWIADALGRLHRFAPSGQWEVAFPCASNAAHIAIDRRDRVYVVTADVPSELLAFDQQGRSAIAPKLPADAIQGFTPAKVGSDAKGNLDLQNWCSKPAKPPDPCACPASEPRSGWFDLNGDPLAKAPVGPTKIYVAAGTYRSEALDSRIAQCQWHRVILKGDLPQGTRIGVRTFTSEVVYSKDELDQFGAWQSAAAAQSLDGDAQWDCLVRSVPGRYLWLELELSGNSAATPMIESIVIEFPRISLRRLLPAVFGTEPVSADFTDRFLALYDTTFRSLEHEVDAGARLYDAGSAPATPLTPRGLDFLSWLASWVGLTFDRNWDVATRRRLLKSAGTLFDKRGTRAGLREQLLLLLGWTHRRGCAPLSHPSRKCSPEPANCAPVECPSWKAPALLLEHFCLRRWLRLGAGRLGEQAVLWGNRIVNRAQLNANAQAGVSRLVMTPDPDRDPFLVHAHQFSVFLPARCRDSEQMRRSFDILLRNEAPAHTQFSLQFVEPRFRIGVQSMLGFDSVIAALPQGFALGVTPLGPASVLTSPPHLAGGPGIAVGKEGRMGTTAVLS
ncbi:MAG: hypothetical protein JWN94_4334 [Betaproteobacteria bacterium]|nr:hypothetical protein [Betaproteobacteria bacterium]